MKIKTKNLINWANRLAGINRIRRGESQRIIQKNFENIWNTRGAAINSDWQGNDLVNTGSLRRSLTGGTINVSGTTISITATPPYASYVNDKYTFMQLTEETKRDLMLSFMGKYKE